MRVTDPDAARRRLLWQAHLARVAEEDAARAKAGARKATPEERAERHRKAALARYWKNREQILAAKREKWRAMDSEEREAVNEKRRQRRAWLKANEPELYVERLRRERETRERRKEAR